MAITKAAEAITEWNQVAQNTVGESGTLDCALHYGTMLHLQAALDSGTAHTGTRFITQVSSNTSGDEDWQDYNEFVALIGTAVADAIENAPLGVGETSITLTGHALTTLARWLFIKNGTIANSELVFESAQAVNAVTILDGVTNEHVATTPIYGNDAAYPNNNVAISRVIMLAPEVLRARVLVDNTYDDDGSTLCYKLRSTQITAI